MNHSQLCFCTLVGQRESSWPVDPQPQLCPISSLSEPALLLLLLPILSDQPACRSLHFSPSQLLQTASPALWMRPLPLPALLPQPLQLDARPPPVGGSGPMVESAAPLEAHLPLGGCPSDSPLPAQDLSQRKSLAAEAGGGGHFSLLVPPLSASLAGRTVYYSKGGIQSAGLEMGGHCSGGWPGSGRLGCVGATPPPQRWAGVAPYPGSSPTGPGAGGHLESLRLCQEGSS